MSIDLGIPTAAVPGTAGVPALPEDAPEEKKRDFTSDQEVRWCPGCGDYAVLAAVQSFLPSLRLRRENIVFVSGIGCSSRFPYYLDTYGMHSIHGRAPAIATGLATSREDLSVWVVTGDGDALSIGGNHLIHAMRRNINMTILLFNNRIYGLTKGQYSPTSEPGTVTKSSPMGSLDAPFNPVSLALGAEATFVARTMDSDRKHLTSVLQAAAEHRGTSLVEIYQNCPIFNDGAFRLIKDAEQQKARLVHLTDGEPVAIGGEETDEGTSERRMLVRTGSSLTFLPEAEVRSGGLEQQVVVHDPAAPDPSQAFGLSRLDSHDMTYVPMGVFRSVDQPTYDDQVRAQVEASVETAGGPATDADLQSLLAGHDTWTVEG